MSFFVRGTLGSLKSEVSSPDFPSSALRNEVIAIRFGAPSLGLRLAQCAKKM